MAPPGRGVPGTEKGGAKMTTITITGLGAAAIERAHRASFYGITKLWPSDPDCIAGRIAAEKAVSDWLEANVGEWNSSWIVGARAIGIGGTKTPYKAEIDFNWD